MSRHRTQLAVVPKSDAVPLRQVRIITPKQEAFARAYVETGNASEAYRRSYDTAEMAPDTINRKACDLLHDGKVTARIAEIEAECLAATQLTVGRIVSEGFKILELANARGDTRAAIATLATLEKLHARLSPEPPKMPADGKPMGPTSEWLAGILGAEAIDRPPRETREEWLMRAQRDRGAKLSDAELSAVAAEGKDPRAWLEEQARAATPEGKRETRARVVELLERQDRQRAAEAEVDADFPVLRDRGTVP